jgi:glycosyltransferase involved in cell wall biosynthesis
MDSKVFKALFISINMPELSIVIPFFNEGKNVNKILYEISKNLSVADFSYEIIAVNNGSSDNTQKILEEISKKNKNVKLVKVKRNIGYGYGIKRGLEAAAGELIGYMWADDFAGAKKLKRLVKEIRESNVSLIKVTRTKREDSYLRKIQSACYNLLMRLVFGIKSRDLNGCPKIMKNSFYRTINLKSNDWFIDAEVMIKLIKSGYEFKEVPVDFERRKYGESHVKWHTCFEFFKNIAKYKFRKFKYE